LRVTPPTPTNFKLAARRLATGVTIVTTRVATTIHGATVSAFIPVSLDPLQVLVSLGRNGRLAAMLRESGVFAVNILSADQEHVSRLFASPERPAAEEEFADIATYVAATGAPIVEECLAAFDCTLAEAIDSGDHTLFIGEVQALVSADGSPLIYFDGGYRGLRLAYPEDHP
jgi:flavin reductase (DIM6/NTAB) family NADH-FMN oxidoreductase RutF